LDKYLVEHNTLLAGVELAHSARMMQDMLSQVGEPVTGSAFALVNHLLQIERSSDWCRGFLTAALEHMEMWGNHIAPLTFPTDLETITRFRPVQTLSRAAIESASQAIWIMDSLSPRVCALRQLVLIFHDLKEQATAADPSRKPVIARNRQTLIDRIASEISGEEIENFPGYLRVVKQASITAAAHGAGNSELADTDAVERLWRSSAGAAHGKQWPSLDLQIVEMGPEVAPGIFATTRLPDQDAVTSILRLANSLVC
jgi:hypothetical protein